MQEILFLAHRVPWPPDRGDKIRSFHFLKKLQSMAPVHVGAFADDDRDMAVTEEMRGGFASVHVETRGKPQWQAGIEALVRGVPVSLAAFHSAKMAQWVDVKR